jgi:hypothetical protein
MTPRPRIDWPAQTPPDDFADRVVAAALTERVVAAQDEPAALGAGDLLPRNSVQPRARGWRGYMSWLVAAAFGMMVFAGIVVHDKTQEAARQQAIAAEQARVAAEENAKLRQQMVEAMAKVDTLMDQLSSATSDAQRSELKRKIDEEKARQVALKRAAGGGGDRVMSKPPCKCQPGDPLCSCL